MGDRVILQVVSQSEPKEFSPAIYCHWLGANAVEAVKRLAKRMNHRRDDVPYIAARLVQEVIDNDDGDISFGIWNEDHVLTAADSQGDAGVILVNASTFEMTFLGGYLSSGQ